MAGNRIPYFRFYPTDFMRGVRGMTPQEVGAYTMLLCVMYENDGPVEYNADRLAAQCGMRLATFSKVIDRLMVLRKIILTDGMISNERADLEISKRENDLKNNSKAGKASAEKRQQKQGAASTGVQQSFNHTDTDTDTVKREAKASQQKPRASRLSPDWFLPKEWGEWAVSEGCSVDLIRSEADKFRDYWTAKAGASAAKLDWLATWRNWIRAAMERAPSSKQNGKRNDGFDNHGSAQGRGNGVDPALANILRLAGVGQTSGDDCAGTGGAGEEIRPFRLGS